jgi:hypothetical protein
VEIDAPLILARWTYYSAATVLFGWSLFPLYAGPSRDEAARALPRTVATVLAAAALTAAILWLLFFAAALGEPEDAAEWNARRDQPAQRIGQRRAGRIENSRMIQPRAARRRWRAAQALPRCSGRRGGDTRLLR